VSTDPSPSVIVRGVDVNHAPYSLFTKVEFVSKPSKKKVEAAKEPFLIKSLDKGELFLHFHVHYGEPTLTVEIDVEQLVGKGDVTYIAVYNPFDRQWEFCVPV